MQNFIFFTSKERKKLFFQKDLSDNFIEQNKNDVIKSMGQFKKIKTSNIFLKKEILQATKKLESELKILIEFEETVKKQLEGLKVKKTLLDCKDIDFEHFHNKYPLTEIFEGKLCNNYEVKSFNLDNFEMYRKNKNAFPILDNRKSFIEIIDSIEDNNYEVTLEDGKLGGKIYFAEKFGTLTLYIKYKYGSSSTGYPKIITVVSDQQEVKMILDSNFEVPEKHRTLITQEQKKYLDNLVYSKIQYKIQLFDIDNIMLECQK